MGVGPAGKGSLNLRGILAFLCCLPDFENVTRGGGKGAENIFWQLDMAGVSGGRCEGTVVVPERLLWPLKSEGLFGG